MLIMEHLCVICAIECVMATFLKPKMLKFRISSRHYKSNYHLELRCFMVSLLDNLVLCLALKLLGISLSFIFRFHFSDLLQISIIN